MVDSNMNVRWKIKSEREIDGHALQVGARSTDDCVGRIPGRRVGDARST